MIRALEDHPPQIWYYTRATGSINVDWKIETTGTRTKHDSDVTVRSIISFKHGK
jgi:hypothetical protein